METSIIETEEKLKNIINAISKGLTHESLKDEMDRLEEKKIQIQTRLLEIKHNQSVVNISEDSVKNLLSKFNRFVRERNIPECKKFIIHMLMKY